MTTVEIPSRIGVRNPHERATTAPARRLGVTIASADGSDLGPKGHHLRWFVPRSAGFPAEGFEIFRIPYDQWRGALRREGLLSEADLSQASPGSALGVPNWSGRDRQLRVHDDLDLVFRDVTALASIDRTLRLVRSGGAANLLLRFRTPVIYVGIEMSVSSTPTSTRQRVTGFHHSARLATTPFKALIEMEQPGITDLLLPLAFDRIKRIVFVRETDLVEAVDRKQIGEPVRSLALPSSAAEAYALLESDVAAGISNRWLKTDAMDELMDRYRPNDVSRLVDNLGASVVNPELVVTAPGAVGQAPFPVRVLDYLHFAALDSNIARMLASYWVDQTPGEFLYMVAAYYNLAKKNLVFGFGFTRHAARAPKINAPVTARQLPGIDYRAARPHGRVGLLWRRDNGDYANPAKPVFVDVERSMPGARETLTKESPQLIGSRSDICFRDSPPAPANVRYRVTPIDVFGRRGPTVDTDVIPVRDLEAPVPPKNVRAILEQKGFPWQQPAQRQEPYIRQGTLAATAEFGEAQRRASPDAAAIRWRWRAGSLPNAPPSPASWNLLATAALVPPLQAKVTWIPGDSPTVFRLPVKTVRPLQTLETQRRSASIAPLSTDAAAGAGSGLVELLIDRPFLEPGLFDGYEITTGQGNITVIGTHAGIAASQDDSALLRAARLVVEASPAAGTIHAGDTVTLRNPFDADEGTIQALLRDPGANHLQMPAPLLHVTLQKPLAPDQAKAVGGEVAIEYPYLAVPETDVSPARIQPVDSSVASKYKQVAVIIGRVVSDVQTDASASTFILRLTPADLLRVMLISILGQPISTTARFHAPNVLPKTTIGLNGEAGDIEIAMPLSQRYTALHLSATSIDAAGRESTQVAAPFELRIVNPPPVVTPSAPYPFGGDSLTPYGEVAPPDHHGRSSVHVAWEPIDLPGAPADGVRYELARALDASIIASDRDRWRRGDATDHFAALGITPGATVKGTLKTGTVIDQDRGTFQVKLKGLDQGAMEELGGLRGRIRIAHRFGGPAGQTQELTHRLLKVVASAGEVTLLCQPFFEVGAAALGEIFDGAAFSAQGSPDYAAVRVDEGRLRQLADLRHTTGPLKGEGRNESAFGVVTGVPIAGTDFFDTVPGIGRSRYLYKVRAVFPGQVRSAWSPASAPFRQIDLSPGQAPEILQVQRGPTGVTIALARPDGPGVRGLRVLAGTDAARATTIATFAFDPRGDELPLGPAPLRPVGRLVDLRRMLQQTRAAFGDEPQLLGIYDAAIDRDAPPAGSNLLTTDARRVRDIVELPSAPPDGRPVIVQIKSDSSVTWLSHIEHWVEVHVDVAATEGDLFVQTVKEILYRGRTLYLDSPPVRVGGAS